MRLTPLLRLRKPRTCQCVCLALTVVLIWSAYRYREERSNVTDQDKSLSHPDRANEPIPDAFLQRVAPVRFGVSPGAAYITEKQDIIADTSPVDDAALALSVTDTSDLIEFLPNYKNPCWEEQQADVVKFHCLPYFYLAGQPKCGTSDLYYQLTQHPHIARGSKKEPHWWARKRVGKYVTAPVPFRNYLEYFDNATRTISSNQDVDGLHHIITGEASSSTLWDNDKWTDAPLNANRTAPKYLTAHYIHALTPKAKIIIILRNPTERLYSDALYFDSVAQSRKSLHQLVVDGISMMEKCIKKMGDRSCVYNSTVAWDVGLRLRVGMYYTFIKDWLDVFPRDQIHVTRLEDYAVNRLSVLNEIYRFLGIPLMNDTATLVQTRSIVNKGKKRPTMHNTMKLLLDKFYKPYNKKLAVLLDDDRFRWES